MSDAHEHGHDSHAAPVDPLQRITYFGATHTRGKRDMFGIRAIDRGKHMYVIGKTGMGKSTMLENMAIQDIQNGEGIAFIDPHGSTAEKLLDFVPHDRIKDVVYFAPFDTDYPIGFNVMEDVGYDKRHLVVSGLMGAFKRIWVDAWSARMEYILQNTLLALLEYEGSTLLDVNRMLTNKTFRNAVIERITDPIVKAFWTEEFASFTDTYTREATPAIQNKIGQFTANPLIRNIVGQPTSTFDLRKMMDEKKIFIVNLSKGRMGESNAALLGSMLTVKIYLAAMSRAGESASRMSKLPPFYFYVDEFQSMMNEAFADILSESRKYKLALTLANQYIEQMEEKVREAVFGNVGTLIVFRVGPFDAEVLKTVFEPTFMAEDLVGLGLGQIYLTLMIDGVGSAPFSAQTIPPIEPPAISYREDVVTNSRAGHTRTRAEVEQIIGDKQKEFAPPPKKEKDSSTSSGSRRYDGPPRSSYGGGSSNAGAPPPRRDQPYRSDARPPQRDYLPRDVSSVQSRDITPPALTSPEMPLREDPRPVMSVAPSQSLREAIEAARNAQTQKEAKVGEDVKAPIDILRQKFAQRGHREAIAMPPSQPRFAVPPRPVSSPLHSPRPQPQPQQQWSVPKPIAAQAPPKEETPKVTPSHSEPISSTKVGYDDEAVSHDVVKRILRGAGD